MTNKIVRYLPKDFFWLGARTKGTNLYNMFRGLAEEVERSNRKIDEVIKEHDIYQTKLLLDQWEKMLGIPGTVLDTKGSIEERRRIVLIKLASLTAQTEQSFIDIAKLFGYDIDIIPGGVYAVFPMRFPILFASNARVGRFFFRLKFIGDSAPIRFPLTFPAKFSRDTSLIIELFKQLIPANVKLVVTYD